MDLKEKKEQLVKTFNNNQQTIQQLQSQQQQIVGQLNIIQELEGEQKETKKK